MKERRIKEATIGQSGNQFRDRGYKLQILDETGQEHRLYGTPEEMLDLGRKILQALPQSLTQETQSLMRRRSGIESRLRAISHNLSTEHHSAI